MGVLCNFVVQCTMTIKIYSIVFYSIVFYSILFKCNEKERKGGKFNLCITERKGQFKTRTGLSNKDIF